MSVSLSCGSRQVLEMLCSRVEQFITQRGRAVASLTSHQRRNKSNLLHVMLADPSLNESIVNNGNILPPSTSPLLLPPRRRPSTPPLTRASGIPLADVHRMCVAVDHRIKWLRDKCRPYTSPNPALPSRPLPHLSCVMFSRVSCFGRVDSCKRVAKQIRDQGGTDSAV